MLSWSDTRLAELPLERDFRLRGLAPTRLEALCDAAFAFAVTLLVISGGIPTSYQALVAALSDIPAFLASFVMLATLWQAHRNWSRRFGIEDGPSTLLSLAMIFAMLVYVYPLRMVASAFMSFLSGGRLPTRFTLANIEELAGLFVIYGVGFAVQTALLALLYRHALRLAAPLGLSPLERLRTRQEIVFEAILGGTALASALAAATLPPRWAVWSGFAYTSLPLTMTWTARRYARQADRLRG